jgi:hypothetical protein
MKKLLTITLIILAIFLLSGSAFAWRGYYRGPGYGFGFILPPPPIWIAPPAVYYRGYYPPPSYYGPNYYSDPYREWVPGHWENRWTPYGWQRVWIPGYWQYGP